MKGNEPEIGRFSGRAHVYGDNIDTDRLIPGKYTKTLDMSRLAAHVLEDLDPGFRARVKPGDILVAGENFGCGSSREQAPRALKAVGIAAVVAASFARIFYRNAINIGLPVIAVGPHAIEQGDVVSVDLRQGVITIGSGPTTYQATPLSDMMLQIMESGGLVAFLKQHGDFAGLAD